MLNGYPSQECEYHGLKVFGTFVCGGGSTMGYKLAGYEHLGGVEIDPKIAKIYNANHAPKHLYVEDIRDFVKRNDIPQELYELDILDGSPPCSTFSMSGSREKSWGKKKKFREGQKEQVLDDLFFEYIKLAEKLKPKVIVAENVKGMLAGNARSYVRRIKTALEKAGYEVQLFLLNSAAMGIPQQRERVFFICRRKDLKYKILKLKFNERPIAFKEVLGKTDETDVIPNGLTLKYKKYWKEASQGASVGKFHTIKKARLNSPLCTIVCKNHYHPIEPRKLSLQETCMAGSFPLDFNFQNNEYTYVIGMSVPPVMMAQIAHQIKLQWF
jgi:DNA (cytosine-5)-methyltransferase 1